MKKAAIFCMVWFSAASSFAALSKDEVKRLTDSVAVLGEVRHSSSPDKGIRKIRRKVGHNLDASLREVMPDKPQCFLDERIDGARLHSQLARRSKIQEVLHDRICTVAYTLCEQRGCQDGRALEDWLNVERQLVSESGQLWQGP